jgi:hypothetical protein
LQKEERLLYKPGISPAEILIPPMTFIELSGAGQPGAPEFVEVIGTLYNLAYTVRMASRNGLAIPGYQEFTVYPLEGIWDLSEAGRQAADPAAFGVADKRQLIYRMMIRQPDFVTPEIFPAILSQAARKKKLPLLDQVRLIRLEEGLCVQMTHVGSYDDEPASFAGMQDFCAAHGLRRLGHQHREIYMSDPRRTAPEATRTVLRWTVERV